MPRSARKKSEKYMYHFMSRSISEIDLFKNDDDKNHYLRLLKNYKDKFQCRIYAYCLMTNHVHVFIDTQGFDISKFMLCLNTAYVCYFNKKYKRHGHLFQGRFTSTVINNDLRALRLSAYIHNNPKDIITYSEKEDVYPYSSYRIYIGKGKDKLDILDTKYILFLFNINVSIAMKQYRNYVLSMKRTKMSMELIRKSPKSHPKMNTKVKSTLLQDTIILKRL